MTVLPKPSAIIQKPDTKTDHLSETTVINCEEEKVDVHTYKKTSRTTLKDTLIFGILFVILISAIVFNIYDNVWTPRTRRYQGYCSIPIPKPKDLKQMVGPELTNMVPLHWSSDDLQLIATKTDARADVLLDVLREELDLADRVERISVINNGHRVDFIHDFTDNTTGIVDDERCFVMELEPELVLLPELFIAGLQSGEPFDVSRVRSRLRARLPAGAAASAPAGLRAACAARPLYRLARGAAMRKRAARGDAPHDYIHFAGKHVQEIQIDNLSEILEYERQNKA